MVETSTTSRLNNRRALEALRNGVPNGDAVAVLGCSQPAVESAFNDMLSRLPVDGERSDGGQGMLVAGDFGSGKSHLLGYLENWALSQNFVCSRVVISKETPLFDMDKVYRAVVENGKVPGVTGQMVGGDHPEAGLQCPRLLRLLFVGQRRRQQPAPDSARHPDGPRKGQ